MRGTLDESYTYCRGEDQDKEPNKECLPPYHGWLEFFVGGLAQQLEEVKARGTMAIRRDILVHQHRLNERQNLAIEYLLGWPQMDIRTLESLALTSAGAPFSGTWRSSKARACRHEGETNQLIYKLVGELRHNLRQTRDTTRDIQVLGT